MKNENYVGVEYQFKLGKIYDEVVEECRESLKTYCKNLVEDEEVGTNSIAYLIGTEKGKVSDAILFQNAVSYYKEFLKEQIEERNKHIVVVQKSEY